MFCVALCGVVLYLVVLHCVVLCSIFFGASACLVLLSLVVLHLIVLRCVFQQCDVIKIVLPVLPYGAVKLYVW